MGKGYVYVIEDELGRVKIGKSTNPVTRIQSISTASGLSIVKTYVTPALLRYGELEMDLHSKFSEYRGIGEWFSVSFDNVVEYIAGDDLSYYDSHKAIKKYIRLSKRIVTMKSIRHKKFNVSEKQLLFCVFMYHNVKSKLITDSNNKPIKRSDLCKSTGWSDGHLSSTIDSLISKQVIQRIINGKSVCYKFV